MKLFLTTKIFQRHFDREAITGQIEFEAQAAVADKIENKLT